MKTISTKIIEHKYSIQTFIRVNSKGQELCDSDGVRILFSRKVDTWNGNANVDPFYGEFYDEQFYIKRTRWLYFCGYRVLPFEHKTIRVYTHDIIRHCALGDPLEYPGIWDKAGLAGLKI